MRALRLFCVVVLSLCAVHASSWGKPADSKPAAKGERPAAAPEVRTVRLLDAGKEPRTKFRAALAKGTEQLSEQMLETRISMELEGKPMPPAVSPKLAISFRSVVGDTTDEVTGIGMEVTDLKALAVKGSKPAEVTAADEALRKFVGTKGSIKRTRSFAAFDNTLTFPDGLDAASRQAIEAFGETMNDVNVELPQEAIGQGAEWEVDNTVRMIGVTQKMTSRFSLKRAEGNSVTLAVAMTATAPKQELASPGSPDGIKIQMLEFGGSGRGEVTIAMDRPNPTSGEFDYDMSLVVGLTRPAGGGMPAGEHRMTQKIKMLITIKDIPTAAKPATRAEPQRETSSPTAESAAK